MTALANPRPIDATLSVTKAAHVLGVHPNTIRAWSEQGRLRYYRINSRGDRRYRVADLRGFMADAEHGPGRPARAAAGTPWNGREGHLKPPRRDYTLPGLADRLDRSRSRVGPGVTALAATQTSAAATSGVHHLAQLAALAGSGGSLDRLLNEAARLIREATASAEVSIWQLRDDNLVRVAITGSGSRPSPRAAATSVLASRALTQRRPTIEVRRTERGSRGSAHKAEEIAVPIGTDDPPWGSLLVRMGRILAAGDQTIAWLEAAAGILAGGVRASALLAEAAQELHRAEALRRAATDTNATFEIEETLSRLVEHAMALFGADRSGLFLGAAGGEAVAEVSRGLSPAYLAAVRQFPATSLPAAAAAERRTLFANDYRHDPRSRSIRAAVVLEGFDTIAAAPLLDGDEAIGVLVLYHDRPKAWSPVELETLAAFGSQATVAIRTSEQYRQLVRWAAQLQSIHHLGARLSRLTTAPEIGTTITNELGQLIEYDSVRVYRLDGQDLNAVALQARHEEYFAETPELVRSRMGEGITGWVAAHGIAQNLPNTSIDPRTEDIPGLGTFDESMLLAPMIFEDLVLGVIVLVRRGLNQFSDDDMQLLEIYASLAAQAMATVETTQRLREQSAALERQLRSQRELLQITESILSTLDSSAVLDQIAERLGRLVRYDTIAIESYDRRTARLMPLTAMGGLVDAAAVPHGAADDTIAAWVIEKNRARLVAGETGEQSGLSRIVAPLRGRDGVTGLLTLVRSADIEPFTSDEFELVQLFAGQVSIALQNAETHRAVEVRARTDTLTGLLNHGTLREWLVKSAAESGTFSLIMLDLDGFKAVNDAFGHQAGDRLLSQIAYVIVAAGRDSDLVFRYGGDEFAILLPKTDVEGAMEVAQRISAAVRGVATPAAHGTGLQIAASVGVATFPADAATAEDVLLAADRACFVAKREGGNRIATAAEGISLAAEFSLQPPTPVDPPTVAFDAASRKRAVDRAPGGDRNNPAVR